MQQELLREEEERRRRTLRGEEERLAEQRCRSVSTSPHGSVSHTPPLLNSSPLTHTQVGRYEAGAKGEGAPSAGRGQEALPPPSAGAEEGGAVEAGRGDREEGASR